MGAILLSAEPRGVTVVRFPTGVGRSRTRGRSCATGLGIGDGCRGGTRSSISISSCCDGKWPIGMKGDHIALTVMPSKLVIVT